MTANTSPDSPRVRARGLKNSGITRDNLEWLRRLRAGRGETWLVRDQSGVPLVAKRIDATTPASCDRVARVARAVQRVDDDAVLQVRGVQTEGTKVWVYRDYDSGVALDRLLAVASPAPSQVAAMGEGLYGRLESLHRSGIAHGAVVGGNVIVGRDGRIRLADAGIVPALRGAKRAPAQRRDLVEAAALLRSLLKPDRIAGFPALAELLRSRALDEAESAGAAAALVTSLRERGSRHDDGLAALAAYLGSGGAIEPAEGRDPASSASQLPEHDAGRAALSAVLTRGRPRRRRRLPPLLLGTGAAGVVGAATAAILLLSHHGAHPAVPVARPTHAATFARSPLPTPTAAAGSTVSAALQPPAPSSASFITTAMLTADGPCAPGGTCSLVSRFDLGAHDGETVDWQVVAVDTCTSAQTPLFSASITLTPDYLYVYDQRSVALPAGHPLELYAVSAQPARVASAPLPVTAPGLSCAG